MKIDNYDLLNRMMIRKYEHEGDGISRDEKFWIEVKKCYELIIEHNKSGGKWGVIIHKYDKLIGITTLEYWTSEFFTEENRMGFLLDRWFVYFIREHHLNNIVNIEEDRAQFYLAAKLHPWWRSNL